MNSKLTRRDKETIAIIYFLTLLPYLIYYSIKFLLTLF